MRQFSTHRRRLILVSLALAFLAQTLFTGETFTRTIDINYRLWSPAQTVACALLAISAALAAAAFAQPRREIPHPAPAGPGMGHPFGGLGRVLIVPAICYATSLAVYTTLGENAAVHLLWVAGAAALLFNLWRAGKTHAAPRAPQPVKPLTRGQAWAEWLAVAAITVAGFDLRYWRLTELPFHFDDDVSLMGWFSLDMLHQGDTRWFGMSGSGHVLSSHQFLIWSMRLFGENHYGLVMVSVLLGTLTLPVVYLLGRETFGRWAGFAAMAMLAGSYTHIHFCRIMFGPGATFFTTAAFCAFFCGWRSQRDLPFAVSGLALGTALLTYDSARVGPVVIAALFVTSCFWQPEEGEGGVVRSRHWVLLAAGALLAFGPMLAYVCMDFSRFVGRGNSVMLWSPTMWEHSLDKYHVQTVGGVLFEQVRHTFLALHLYGDESPHFGLGRPMVDAIAAALFTMGAGFCLWRWRDPRCFALLAWIGLTFVLGGVLTADPPYWPHLNIALPAIVLVAGAAADRIGRIAFCTATQPRGAVAFALLLIGVLSWSGLHSWQVYRKFAAHTEDPRVQSARYIQDLPPGTDVYLVDAVIGWHMYSFKFLDRRVKGVTLNPDDVIARKSLPPLTGPTAFIVYRNPELAQAICDAYEGEQVVRHVDGHGNQAFTSIELNVHAVPPPGGTRMPANPWTLPGWWLIAGAAAVATTASWRRLQALAPAGGLGNLQAAEVT